MSASIHIGPPRGWLWSLAIVALLSAGHVAEAQITPAADPIAMAPQAEREGSDAQAENPSAVPVAQEDPIPTRSLWDMLIAGGPLIAPIALCSFVLFIFVFERFVSLRRGRVIPKPFVKRFLQQLEDGELDRDQALELCEENRSHVASVFAGAVRKWGRPAVEVEQAIIDAGERAANDLNRYLRVINGVATVSPLLGLLGTVWGMMQAFNAIATSDAMGRPELLAAGISQALLTTAAGLFVAIPALILHLFFVGRVDQHVVDIDGYGQELVGIISAEALQEAKSDRKPRGKRQAA